MHWLYSRWVPLTERSRAVGLANSGIPLGTVFALVALAGAPLVFHVALLKWQHPSLQTQAPVTDGRVLEGIVEAWRPRGLRALDLACHEGWFAQQARALGFADVLGVDARSGNRADRLHIERNTGVLFQDGALFSSLTVAENIAVPVRENTALPADLPRVDCHHEPENTRCACGIGSCHTELGAIRRLRRGDGWYAHGCLSCTQEGAA